MFRGELYVLFRLERALSNLTCVRQTVTLMLRSVGALIFGVISDRYGRKWPMMINLGLFIVLELATGFCNTLPQFLGVRALYGIAMGGMFRLLTPGNPTH